MNPSLDTILVFAAVLGAVAFFAVRVLRKKKSCASGCGCGVAKKPLHPEGR